MYIFGSKFSVEKINSSIDRIMVKDLSLIILLSILLIRKKVTSI